VAAVLDVEDLDWIVAHLGTLSIAVEVALGGPCSRAGASHYTGRESPDGTLCGKRATNGDAAPRQALSSCSLLLAGNAEAEPAIVCTALPRLRRGAGSP